MNNSLTIDMNAISEEQALKEKTRENIRNGATFDLPYITMNILATIIACYGLFANSPAVVIGAMIVAMLLGPIAGVGLALVDNDTPLLSKALKTLVGGTLGVAVTAFVLGIIHKNVPITNEIMARTAPNLMDLMIALAGGAAGAYATISSRLSVAFVGVAIATALVPPISSGSILLARGETKLAFGAFLLAFTNMVAIQFASSVVLWLNGFRRVTNLQGLGVFEFAWRNKYSLFILLVLGVLLTINLQQTVSRQLYETRVRGALRKEIESTPGSHLAQVRFQRENGNTIIRAVVRASNAPTPSFVSDLERTLPQPPNGTKNELRIRFVETTIINRNGSLFSDVEFGSNE